MFEARVAQFYRAKGYEVHEGPRVRGASENVYTVAMVAEGPLGALLISFGDAGGIDAAEVGRVRTMARDIGATPVLAAPQLSPDLRRLAAQMGVVVIDEPTVTETGPHPRDLPTLAAADPLRRDLEAHPWPASGRAFAPAGPVPRGARDVDELVADLHKASTPAAASTAVLPSTAAPQSTSASAPPVTALQSAVTVPQPAPAAPVPPAGPKFAWLGGGTGLLESSASATSAAATNADPVDLSKLLGAREKPATPAVEVESALHARQTRLGVMEDATYTLLDNLRDWPWKTILLAISGAGLLVLLIRTVA